jgi:hypothetical protein
MAAYKDFYKIEMPSPYYSQAQHRREQSRGAPHTDNRHGFHRADVRLQAIREARGR